MEIDCFLPHIKKNFSSYSFLTLLRHIDFGFKIVHSSFISRDKLRHEALKFCIVSVQKVLGVCVHMSAFFGIQ
jgi:hypothetical protein